jgi:DNA-binding winged helix-turn-helix (wHTH) protein/TolB-like protein
MRYRFGVFEFDRDSGQLRKNGRDVALEPQPARALARLLAQAGETVPREELRDAVWGPETHVDFDRGLAYCLSQIRAALGDSAENARFVQTLPKRGYKFIAPVTSISDVAAAPVLPPAAARRSVAEEFRKWQALGYAVVGIALVIGWLASRGAAGSSQKTVIAVSVFDNETGEPQYDRLVTGLSDLVVARLVQLAPAQLDIIGNAAVLRQPRNIRNLKAVAAALPADYVLLGQLQRGEDGLRFITHFIRLADEAHLRANRLQMPGGGATGMEAAVTAEFERAVKEHVLKAPANSFE